MAVRHAITSARHDAGLRDYFQLNIPATPEHVQRLCAVDSTHFTIGTPAVITTATATATTATPTVISSC
jgi:hypothetical protein